MNYSDNKFPALLALLGGLIVGIWGILHLSFTEWTVAQYSHLPVELLKAIRTEWVIEGIFLLFVSVLVISLYPRIKDKSRVARKVAFYCGSVLLILAIWHLIGSSFDGLSHDLYAPLLAISAILIWMSLIFHKGEWS